MLTLSRYGIEQPLITRVAHARSWRDRLVGLLGRGSIANDEGLWITPCNSIHTLGMRFDIDVLFLDEQLRIVRTLRGLAPWRCAMARARSVVELSAGSIDRFALHTGERLRLTPRSLSQNHKESLA